MAATASLTAAEWTRFEQGVTQAYQLARLDPPRFILQACSPLAATLAAYAAGGTPLAASAVEPDVRRSVDYALSAAGAPPARWVEPGEDGRIRPNDWRPTSRQILADGTNRIWKQTWAAISDGIDNCIDERTWKFVRETIWHPDAPTWLWQTPERSVAADALGGEPIERWFGSGILGQNLDAAAQSRLARDVWTIQPKDKKWHARVAILEAAALPPLSIWRRGVVAACDRPTHTSYDKEGRLHAESGPAIEWSDNWSLYYWHGVQVPADLLAWNIERALAEPNVELRRCALERIGWTNLIDRLTLVDDAPDPGNPGQQLELYDLPAEFGDDQDGLEMMRSGRVLIVTNASVDKGGHRRKFGLLVPWTHSALEAAASLFDIPTETYAALGRAT